MRKGDGRGHGELNLQAAGKEIRLKERMLGQWLLNRASKRKRETTH